MKHLLEAINRGILRGINENNIELLTDLDDSEIDLLDSILTKSMNNKIDCSIKQLLADAIQTGKLSGRLKQVINDPNNFNNIKWLIKANDKDHLKELINVGLELFGNDGNFNWIDTGEITDMSDLFYDSDFNGHIELWDVSDVTNMAGMFNDAYEFNLPIGRWNVSNVTNMQLMFYEAKKFNLSIGDWDVSNVTKMTGMFDGAEKFNLPIGRWDVSNVTDMKLMFNRTEKFNHPIGDWDVSNVTNMYKMFQHARSFNLPIGGWDVSNVTDMTEMFCDAKKFNYPICNWDVSNVFHYAGVFFGCSIKEKYKPRFIK